jgi:hypothetical protein
VKNEDRTLIDETIFLRQNNSLIFDAHYKITVYLQQSEKIVILSKQAS